MYDLLIRNATLIDGSGGPPVIADLAVQAGRIAAIGKIDAPATQLLDASGKVLSPGFIDVHTHDDLEVIRTPAMPSKISQGVTTVVVGNCGISASPVSLRGEVPDPMNLLGEAGEFRYADFAAYRDAVQAVAPAVNVAALVGHTSLRSNHMDRLDRAASDEELQAMRRQLRESLAAGALGLSSGLAYASASHAPASEVLQLSEELSAGSAYASHLRDEFAGIVPALDEAIAVGRRSGAHVRISHLKCAGVDNWGRSREVLSHLQAASEQHDIACDCYPYAASSSTLDLGQVTDAYDILITWSEPEPACGGRLLANIAADWDVDLLTAARRLQPAGAVYHCMDEADVQRILAHPMTMIGSDGLPRDPRPHPRLWGSFPRVLGHYVRQVNLFSLQEAVRKMTGLPAQRFALDGRGRLEVGYWADLVLFDAANIRDTADFQQPQQAAQGIESVWVNGQLSYTATGATGTRHGQFLRPAPAKISNPLPKD